MASNRTLGDLLSSARTLLNDTVNTNPAYRYSNAQLLEALNDAFLEARAKRPDLFLGTLGLRETLPLYTTDDLDEEWPLSDTVFPTFLNYVVGRTSLRDDTSANDSRAVVLMNRFVNQLLGVNS